MIICLQNEEESLVKRGVFHIAVPLSVTRDCKTGEMKVSVYPSLRREAASLLRRFPGNKLFSAHAIQAAKTAFDGFLAEHGFAMGEESEDFFRLYRITRPDESRILTTTRPFDGLKGLRNLTGYDLSAMKKYGHLAFVTVIGDAIVSVACTNAPMSGRGGMEIGVETAPGYEGRGFGTSNVAALALALKKQGCTALYECASKNRASVRTAENAGGTERARNYYIVGTK
ncbi:MAG: GNAT family N-acetyltransferase [Ruminococcaceae bacterium]|nr:GNAT family N-acetyltransferase [Oscillospiraceae bacterium]